MSLYLEHFGLNEPPFSIAPNPRYMFLSPQHREALAHLSYGLMGEGGIVVLTGEVGTGKTTVSRKLIEDKPPEVELAWIINPRLAPDELLAALCDELGEPVPDPAKPHACTRAISEALLRRHSEGRNTVLMIDEAQHLSEDALEQLRLLTNLETAERKLLQIILIGQPELARKLAHHRLRQFAQRITARFHLTPLSRRDARAYLEHRWRTAGGAKLPFSHGAVRLLYRASGGIPRRLNLLADRTLLSAYARGSARVHLRDVRRAIREIDGRIPLSGWRQPAAATAALAVAAGLGWAALKTGPAQQERLEAHAGKPPAPLASASSKAPAPAAGSGRASLAGWQPDWTEAGAMRALASLWQKSGVQTPAGDDCATIEKGELRCLKLTGGLAELRRIDRPAIAPVRVGEKTVPLLVTALDGESIMVRDGRDTRRLSLEDFERRWFGSFLILWHAPPGYREPIRPGDSGELVVWLNERLDRTIGPVLPPRRRTRMDAVTVERVREFQRRAGLRPDGAAGPLTLMALNDALGLPRPSLSGWMPEAGGKR